MAYPDYPDHLVIANRQPYAFGVDMGLIRSEMAAGNARQRRQYLIMPHAIALTFTMRIEELYQWQGWVNLYAYDWFTCPISIMYAGAPPDATNMRDEVIRFTSNLQVTMDGWNLVTVAVAAELAPDAFAAAPTLGGWIIGGTPAAPSPDWIIGGTPASPSPDWWIAGTPAAPANTV